MEVTKQIKYKLTQEEIKTAIRRFLLDDHRFPTSGRIQEKDIDIHIITDNHGEAKDITATFVLNNPEDEK